MNFRGKKVFQWFGVLKYERDCNRGLKYSERQLMNYTLKTILVWLTNKKKFELLFNPFHACFNKCWNKNLHMAKDKGKDNEEGIMWNIAYLLENRRFMTFGVISCAASSEHHAPCVNGGGIYLVLWNFQSFHIVADDL